MCYKLKIIEKYEDIFQYKQGWEKLEKEDSECTIYQSYDWVKNYCTFLMSNKKIFIMLYFEKNDLVGVFPFQIRMFRNVYIYELMGSCGVDYLMPIISDIRKEKLYLQFRYWLEQQEDDIVYVFEDLPCTHSFSKYIISCKSCGFVSNYFDSCFCYKICLPDTWNAYKNGLSKRMCHDIEYDRRYLYRNVDAEYKELDINTLDKHIINNKVRMHSRDLKSPFDFNMAYLFWKKYFGDESFKNRLKIHAIVSDTEIVASLISIDVDKSKFILSLSINIEYEKFSPGNVLLGYVIEEAIEKKFKLIDLGRGKDNYKLRFGATEYKNRRHIICMNNEKQKQYISYIFYLYNKIGYFLTDK